VRTREEIDKLRADIVAGAPFAEVARENSIDQQSAAQGGFFQCFPEGQPMEQVVEPFKSTAESLPAGQLSEPVETQFGFHLILVTNGRPFEDVREQIEASLRQQSGQERLRTLLRRLVNRATIEINPRYGRFVKSEEPFGRIVPPTAPTAGAPTTTTTAGLPFLPQG
jgi:parvulin-like peptidyl-prolyl isomerase